MVTVFSGYSTLLQLRRRKTENFHSFLSISKLLLNVQAFKEIKKKKTNHV